MINSNSPSEPSILGVILSGGAGRRFGGKDKGLQLYQGKTLIEHTSTAIKPQVTQLIICINRSENDYRKFGYPLVFDSEVSLDKPSQENQKYQGPLAGVVAASRWLESSKNSFDYLLISSCDSPKLPNDYVGKLVSALSQSDSQCAVVNDGERNQNLHCLIRRNALPSLVTFYHEGGRAMHRWYKKNSLIEVDFSDQADCFSNFNFSEQLTNR